MGKDKCGEGREESKERIKKEGKRGNDRKRKMVREVEAE